MFHFFSIHLTFNISYRYQIYQDNSLYYYYYQILVSMKKFCWKIMQYFKAFHNVLLFLCKLFGSRFKNKTVHACCLISLCNANGIIGLGCTWSWHNRHRPPAEFRNGMTLMTAGRLAITFSACRRRFLLAATLPLSSSCLLCLFASQEVVAKCR